jgi:light-regulated signal transduction histidine kinase (bacteriophytochrome)
VAEREEAVNALRVANTEVQTANQELEAFSYSVAHDLRAPLRSIDGFSQALIEDYDDKLDDGGRLYLKYVREAAMHMARLINDLLGLARIGRAELVKSPADLAVIFRATAEMLRREQPDRQVELIVPSTAPVFGDPRLLAVVIENLLGNAWKFTAKADLPRIELGQTVEAGRTVNFVRDNGVGFDMAYSEKLFAVFQRLHTVGEFDGLGIGLATVQRIILRHGGRIWAHGEVGRGATFYFTLQDAP